MYQYQFGFRHNHSTIHALIEVVDNIYNYLDNKEVIIGIYIDLQKAFDTVNHDILLYKLYRYGIRGVTYNWLASYLSNRQQYCVVNSTKSDVLKIKYGVPQGSVLGPLLFLIYINDIQNSVTDASVKLFADDTNLFLHAKDLNSVIDKSNKCLNDLSIWFIANKLSLSTEKTMYTVVGCRDCNQAKLTFAGNVVRRVSSCKYFACIH